MRLMSSHGCLRLRVQLQRVAVQAEKRMIEKNLNKEYLPMQGLDTFRKATVDLLLGAGNKAVTEACF
jgi:aspartate aminotransferase, chloroplastic